MSHRYISRVADYEPAPVLASLPAACPAPRSARLHQSRTRPTGIERQTHLREQSPPPQAVAFADAAMRRVLEVMDRRRPIAQLRPLLSDGPLSAVLARSSRVPATTAARLSKIRVRRCADDSAEIFGTFERGGRVRAFAGRIRSVRGNWLVVALQLG
ncbi:Rv3235 family protein [Mycobacteroides abscessus]|uniref:Rv3235 family protein n=1 Tax=Mycobacteroides abscessus TaxID=36809 RepID=UPI0021053D45|nr:Rv3235 family protein [Mycobacteroides abscessus]